MNKSSLPLNPQTGDKSSIIKRVSQGEDKMWKVSSYKKRKLVLEVNDFIEMCSVEHVYFSIENLDEIIDAYSKKYPHPRYQFNILEVLDLDWEEEK